MRTLILVVLAVSPGWASEPSIWVRADAQNSRISWSAGLVSPRAEIYLLSLGTVQEEVDLGRRVTVVKRGGLTLHGFVYLVEMTRSSKQYLLPWLSLRHATGKWSQSADVAEYVPLGHATPILYVPEMSVTRRIGGMEVGVVASMTKVGSRSAPIRLGWMIRSCLGGIPFKLNVQPWALNGKLPPRIRATATF